MKNVNHWKRLAAMLAWLLGIYTVLAVLPAGPAEAAAVRRKAVSGSPYSEAAPSTATPSTATPSEATPSTATPSQAQPQITFADTPRLIALETDEADGSSWSAILPRQLEAYTDSPGGGAVWCDISWSVSDVIWDQQGVYLARAQLIPPEGYIFGTYMEPYFDTVISIHPPGTSQVMDVYTTLRYFWQRGHTWTFAMNTGQDITPLVETLKGLKSFTGILDEPDEIIQFDAEWDFSAVDTTKPGIYPIYRRLTLREDSLPPDLDPEQVLIPEYWKTLPVLLSVEEPGKPQLYGVLEDPDGFFGSYARLTDEEYEELEVWYSIDGGPWTLQTGEGLMETDRKNYRIQKDRLEDGTPYSFYLKLAEHTSRILTVREADTPLVWFFWTLDGNRDGTLDVEFPSFSQPPPPGPSEEETTASPTEETPEGPTVGSTEDSLPDPTTGSTEDSLPEPTTGSTEDSSPEPTTGSTEDESANPPGWDVTETAAQETLSPETDASKTGGEVFPESGASGQEAGQLTAGPSSEPAPGMFHKDRIPVQTGSPTEAVTVSQTGSAASESGISEAPSPNPAPEEAVSDSPLLPMEQVGQWTTQISGKRVKKLLELYPDHVVFQKESVSVLVSSDWLKELGLTDSDILTILISPEEGHEVTILVNQKAPPAPPVYEIRLLDSARGRTGGIFTAGAVLLFAVCFVAGILIVRRRKKV